MKPTNSPYLYNTKKKKRKHRIYELDQEGKVKGLSNWFKINTSREKWINDNSYTQTNRPLKLKIIEATPNQTHGYFTFLFSEGVTGFSKDDIEVEYAENMLTIKSKTEDKSKDADKDGVIHRGISKRYFSKAFTVADDVEVKGAELKDGLLRVSMERIIPEGKQARTIKVK